MTAPEIGNTGVNADDPECVDGSPHVAGLHRARREPDRLELALRADARRVPRAARHRRHHRASTRASSPATCATTARRTRAIGSRAVRTRSCAARARRPPMDGLDLVERVTPAAPYAVAEGSGAGQLAERPACAETGRRGAKRRHVVAHRLRRQAEHPALPRRRRLQGHRRARDARARRTSSRCSPDGIFLSNGPGDPAAVSYADRDHARAPRQEADLRHLPRPPAPRARARRARRTSSSSGTAALNQPVKDLATGRVEITTQNHGFCVDLDSLAGRRAVHARAPERRHERGPRQRRRSRPSACSTTRRPPAGRTTRSTCSSASFSAIDARR